METAKKPLARGFEARQIDYETITSAFTFEARIEYALCQIGIFALILLVGLFSVNLALKAVNFSSLPHALLLLACLILAGVLGNMANQKAGKRDELRKQQRLTKSHVTYSKL